MIKFNKIAKIVFVQLIIIFTIHIQGQQKNVLFIAIDDLKPNLGCYGNEMAISPNIDRLASEGTIFANNHTQQAVCAPSRASLLTGWRPDRTQVWDLKTLIRDKNSDVITLPQYFKENGYQTAATGKVFDPRSVDAYHDVPSWSIPYVKVTGSRWLVSDGRPSTESADLPDDNYVDGKIALAGINLLNQVAAGDQPFFLAVGFKKPHLPFVAPQKYWDLYNRDSIHINPFQQPAANAPDYVYTGSGEFRSYDDVPDSGDIPENLQIQAIHGYYACVSFIDVQVQRLIDQLDSLNLKNSTIIVLWGDHGWHLGDHAQWAKHTNFEQATRSPLIIIDPDLQGGKYITSPTEFVDIFPTLCELTGLDVPDNLAGTSLVPLLRGEKDRVKDFAVSQYHRNGNKEGYTIRTDRYRYTEWLGIEYREGLLPYSENIVIDKELYDYQTDPMETFSHIYDPAYQGVMDSLHGLLSEFLIHQFDNYAGSDSSSNLIGNHSFEDGTSFWIERASTLTISTDVVQDSAHALLVSNRTKAWSGAAQVFTPKLISTGAGRYIVSAYYRAALNPDTAKVQIRLTIGDNKKYIQVFGAFDSTGWSHIVDTLDISWEGDLDEAMVTLTAIGDDLSTDYYVDNISIIPDTIYTSVKKNTTEIYLEKYSLSQNYPNPFNPSTRIKYSIANVGNGYAGSSTNVTLKIYDVLGKEVTTLVNEKQNPGNYEVIFNASYLPSGVYFYRLKAGQFCQTNKMILLK